MCDAPRCAKKAPIDKWQSDSMETSQETSQQILNTLQVLLDRQGAIEALLAEALCQLAKVKRPDPRYLSLAAAASLMGLDGAAPVEALRARLRRERIRTDGVRVRVAHGRVFKADFDLLLQTMEQRRAPSREIPRKEAI